MENRKVVQQIAFLNPLILNVFVYVVGYQNVCLMISGTAVDVAFKQGDSKVLRVARALLTLFMVV